MFLATQACRYCLVSRIFIFLYTTFVIQFSLLKIAIVHSRAPSYRVGQKSLPTKINPQFFYYISFSTFERNNFQSTFELKFNLKLVKLVFSYILMFY